MFGQEAHSNTNVNLQDVQNHLTFGEFWELLASKKMLSVAVDEMQKSYGRPSLVRASRRLQPTVTKGLRTGLR